MAPFTPFPGHTYGKVRRIFGVGEQERQNLVVLDELITQGEVGAALTQQFSFEKIFTRDDFIEKARKTQFFRFGI